MTAQTEHSPFPSDETLAAYIDGLLDEETRRQVVEHIAGCAECFDVLQVSHEMPAAPVVRTVQWERNALVGLAAAAAVGGILLLTPLRERIWPDDDIRTLAAAAPPKRSFEGRLTGFPHQELKTMRGGHDKDDNEIDLTPLKFEAAAGKIQQRALEHPDTRALHAVAIAQLELGETKDALQRLQLLEHSSPRDPQLLSDLAVAYLANGNYQAAYETANRAWTLAKTPEIAWNRAVALQRLNRRAEAIAAWKEFLPISDSPEWTKDAQDKLAELQSE